ncbi:LysM domain-containing GPI-anchored protein 2 [Linum perenne]
MNSHFSSSLILLLALLLCSLPAKSTAQPPRRRFQCTANATCRSLIGYKSPNATTLQEIQSFFDVKNLRTNLGSNGLPESTPPSYRVAANQVIRVPVPCVCFNGSGVSNKVPVYKVQPGDGLFVIASSVFMGLVKFEQIAAVNQIADPNLIDVDQELWIPLPCSCEDVDGERVVHYTHVVVGGSSVEQIADEFGTTNDTLYRINGIQNDTQLIEGDPFDVPLKG